MRNVILLFILVLFLMPMGLPDVARAAGGLQRPDPVLMTGAGISQTPVIEVRRIRIPRIVPLPGGAGVANSPWLRFLFIGMIAFGVIAQIMKFIGKRGGKAAERQKPMFKEPDQGSGMSEGDIDALISKYKSNGAGKTAAMGDLSVGTGTQSSGSSDLQHSKPDFGTRSQPMFGKRNS